jgi:hypothetical protein
MTEKTRVKTLEDFRKETKGMRGTTRLMMIDPNDKGHFVQVGHTVIRAVDPVEVIEDQEDYFENTVVAKEDIEDRHTTPVVIFYAAHD